MKNKEELPMNSNRGAVQCEIGFACEDEQPLPAELLRPELTDSASVDQPTLSTSSQGDSGAELASLRGTAVCGTACTVVWELGSATALATRFELRLVPREVKSLLVT